MPLDAAIAGAAIYGGATALGAGANALSQGKLNRRSQMYNWNMWHRQQQMNEIYGHAKNMYDEYWWNKQNTYDQEMWAKQNEYNEYLWNKQNAYNLEMWNKQNAYNEHLWRMQNEYNSPAAQMQRYKEAGLNPHLIYGQSNTGGAVHTANLDSASLGSASYRGHDKAGSSPLSAGYGGSWNPRAPVYDVASGLMAYNQFREKAAQVNNLQEQQNVLRQEVVLKGIQAANIAANTARSEFDLGLARDLRQTSLDAAKLNVQQMQQKLQFDQNDENRKAQMHPLTMKHTIQAIANMEGQNRNLFADYQLKKVEFVLKQYDAYLRSIDVHPSDPSWWRIGRKLLDWIIKNSNSRSTEGVPPLTMQELGF